jgi:hypothetical protein
MIIYKESEKLRAEAYKSIGYFFGSIVGLTVINIIVYGANIENYMNWKVLIILPSLYWAHYFIGIGVKILKAIDEVNSKIDDTLNQEV